MPPSITSWVRLEPRARDADLAAGAEARLHDPLWLLARQWQLGELSGADAGSAITARTRLDVAAVDGLRAAGASWSTFDPARTPLEIALADPIATLDRRARDGRILQAMLAPAAAALFLSKYPLAVDTAALDAAARRYAAVMAGRVPDGDAVAAAIAPILTAGDFPATFGLDPASVASVSATCRTWLARRSTSHGTWRSGQLAYAFEARAGSTRLVAARHDGGTVAWTDVDALPLDATPSTPTAPIVSTALPSHVRYRGAPARRYWDLEDSAVIWPAVTAGPGDVGRLLMVELGLTFADDWLVVPIELRAGSVARVLSHVVTDTFGVRQLVSPTTDLDGANAAWHFCELARDASLPGPLVFVAPTVNALVGPIVDAIDFASDAVANVVWAIDRTILGEDGIGRAPPSAAPLAPAAGSTLVYTLGPDISATCHPYRLHTGAMGLELALAAIPGQPLVARAELPPTIAIGALPQRAARLQRRATLVRASDGSYHLVVRHDVIDIAPPSLPALAFDQVQTS